MSQLTLVENISVWVSYDTTALRNWDGLFEYKNTQLRNLVTSPPLNAQLTRRLIREKHSAHKALIKY